MSFGLIILPDDNRKYIDISTSSRVLSSLGRYNVYPTGGTGGNVRQDVGITSKVTGGVAVAIPTKGVALAQGGNFPRVNVLTGIQVSGSTMSVYGNQSFTGSSGPNYYDISLFEIPNANSGLEAYGIAMYDSVNFLALTDVSQFGYVTYVNTIDINGAWSIPDSVPNKSTCVVFARWNNGSTPIYHDRDAGQLQTFTGFSSTSGSVQGGSVSGVQVVIVSTGFVPSPPSSGYGVVIRNASNTITYSSKYAPVIWRGGYFGIPGYVENDTGGASKIQWIGSSGNVSQPMVPIGSYGFQCGDYSTTGTYPQKVALYSGLLMSGNSISTYRAKSAGGSVYYYQYPVRAQMSYNLPCLDASDYF